MRQQAATPILPNSSTEARADTELVISTDADQLRAIPRRLQEHTKIWPQCWVIVNSSGGKSQPLAQFVSPCKSKSIYLNIYLFLFPSLCSPAVILPVCSSPQLQPYLLHGLPPTAPQNSRKNSSTVPRSLLRTNSTVPVSRSFPWIPTVPPSPLLRCFHGSSPWRPRRFWVPLLVLLVCASLENILNRPRALYLPPVVFGLVVWVAPVVRSTLRVFPQNPCV